MKKLKNIPILLSILFLNTGCLFANKNVKEIRCATNSTSKNGFSLIVNLKTGTYYRNREWIPGQTTHDDLNTKIEVKNDEVISGEYNATKYNTKIDSDFYTLKTTTIWKDGSRSTSSKEVDLKKLIGKTHYWSERPDKDFTDTYKYCEINELGKEIKLVKSKNK